MGEGPENGVKSEDKTTTQDKTQPEAETPSGAELDESIIRQIEFYFGDINLSKDKFLSQAIKEDEGWIPMDTMLKFKRLARLSTDPEVIAKALEKSTLMEVNDDKTKIRRSPDIPIEDLTGEKRQQLMPRTLYVKGFPVDGSVNMNQLLDFFNGITKIDSLTMRNYQDKANKTWGFKGSVFVVFPTVEDAEKFLKTDSIKFNDTELIRKWQTDYIQEQRQERIEIRNQRSSKKKKDEDEGNKKAKENKETSESTFPLGAVIHLSGFTDQISRESVKELASSHNIEVAYIDYNKGDEQGWLRLNKENAAKELMDKLEDGKFIVNGVELKARILEGDEEKQFLERVKTEIIKRKNNIKGRGRKGKSSRGRGHFGNRKRKGSPVGDGPTSAKVGNSD